MIKKCKVCGREFECYDKVRSPRAGAVKVKRPYDSITCSKKCSTLNGRKIYNKLILVKN